MGVFQLYDDIQIFSLQVDKLGLLNWGFLAVVVRLAVLTLDLLCPPELGETKISGRLLYHNHLESQDLHGKRTHLDS